MYRSDCCDVEYLPRQNLVLVTWKRFCCGEEYRKPLRCALEKLKAHPGCQYVADTRQGFENEDEDTQWVFDSFLPAAAATSCKHIFFLIDRDNSLKAELEGQSAELGKQFTVHYCFSLEEVESLLG